MHDMKHLNGEYVHFLLGVCGRLCNPSYWDGEIWERFVDRELAEGSKWPAEDQQYT